MSETILVYQLRIRNQADTADVLVVSSVTSAATPYLIDPPTGDGQGFDPLTGVSTVGVYKGTVLDAGFDSDTTPYLVTSLLADANDRMQLLQRRAFWEWSDDDGSSWNQLVSGYVNAIRLTSPLAYEITVGDSRRIAQNTRVFTRATGSFTNATNMIGSTVKGGFGPLVDFGGWRYEVTAIAGDILTLTPVDGWFPGSNGGAVYKRVLDYAVVVRANQFLRKEFVPTTDADGTTVTYGWFPGINIDLWQDGALAKTTHPVAQSIPKFDGQFVSTDNVLDASGKLKLVWASTTATVGDIFTVYGYSTTIGPDNPLHICAHPIAIETALMDDFGIAYDSTSAASVKAAIGAQMGVALRITDPPLLADCQSVLRGFFGYGTRRNSSGEEEFFVSRLRSAATPDTTVTTASLADWRDVIFDLDEGTICNVVTSRQYRFVRWTEEEESSRPADDLVMVPQTRRWEFNSAGGATPDYVYAGERARNYELPGYVGTGITIAGVEFPFLPQFNSPVDFDAFSEAQAEEVFDRYGRGAPRGELRTIGTTVPDAVGSELLLTLPHQVNASDRGGTRAVQIVQRTELPSGAQLTVIDSGVDAQPATLPTFSLAAGPDSRKTVEITISNAATLNSNDIELVVQMALSEATPTGAMTIRRYTKGNVPASFYTDPCDAGANVWVRMRSQSGTKRPSAWTSWQSHQLDTLDAPTSLSLTGDSPNDGKILATWTVGSNADDIPVEVWLRSSSEATPRSFMQARLPPGSDATILYPGAGTFVVMVRHAEAAPYHGVSAWTKDTVTVSNTETLSAPTSPSGIGENNDGTYGLEVANAETVGNVEFSVAVEDSYDAGTYGSYSVVAEVPIDASGTTTWTGWAADDRKRRKVRARHTRSGATASSYCTAQVVWAWYAYPVTT